MKEDVFMTTFENDNLIMPMSDEGGGGTSSVTLDIESIDQMDYGSEFCLATCYLAIGRYYHPSEDLKMNRLQSEGIVSSNGYVNYWGTYVTRGAAQDFNVSAIKTALAAGKPVIIIGESSRGEHYVVAYGYTGNNIKIMDPWGGVKAVLGNTVLTSWSKYRICTE